MITEYLAWVEHVSSMGEPEVRMTRMDTKYAHGVRIDDLEWVKMKSMHHLMVCDVAGAAGKKRIYHCATEYPNCDITLEC